VLDAVFNVERETVRPSVPTSAAAARDEFINGRSGLFAEWHHVAPPQSDWGTYFRDEIRNAAAPLICSGFPTHVRSVGLS
jgi:hypothetical protein